MHNRWAIALLIVLASDTLNAQEFNPYAQSESLPDQSERLTVYSDGPGVTAPTLLPLNLPPLTTEKCKQLVDGRIIFSVIVDSSGQPRNIMFLHAIGNDLDKLALQIAAADRFSPAIHNGMKVAFAQSLELNLKACLTEIKDAQGAKSYRLHLRSLPTQYLAALQQPPTEAVLTSAGLWSDLGGEPPLAVHPGSGITPPVPINQPAAAFSDAARSAHYEGMCLISMIIDRNGMPQDISIVRKLDYGLDVNAIQAV